MNNGQMGISENDFYHERYWFYNDGAKVVVAHAAGFIKILENEPL